MRRGRKFEMETLTSQCLGIPVFKTLVPPLGIYKRLGPRVTWPQTLTCRRLRELLYEVTQIAIFDDDQ